MLRKASEAVSESNGSTPRQEEFGSRQPTLAGASREIREMLDELHDDLKDGTRRLIEQYAARLEQDARQPRLAMEADGQADTKTRERTKGAATAVQPMRGDGFSAR